MDHWKIVFWLAKEMHIEDELREEPSKTSCVRRNEQTGGSTSWATPSPTSVGEPMEATSQGSRQQKKTAAQKKRRRRTRAATAEAAAEEDGATHDSMQVPTSATGHGEEAQAAATGDEEALATATGQEKKSAAEDQEAQATETTMTATGPAVMEVDSAAASRFLPFPIPPRIAHVPKLSSFGAFGFRRLDDAAGVISE